MAPRRYDIEYGNIRERTRVEGRQLKAAGIALVIVSILLLATDPPGCLVQVVELLFFGGIGLAIVGAIKVWSA